MREVLVIGMGAGDPAFMTVEAIEALRAADVLFVLEKAAEQHDLIALREELVARFAGEQPPRTVVADDPPRARGADPAAQRAAVAAWREARSALVAGLLRHELADDEVGAFLVWGAPTLYDSVLAVLDGAEAHPDGVPFSRRVVAGISAPSALAARHGTSLTRVGRPLVVTTGRRLADEGWPAGADDVVVMLDADCAFRELPGDVHIHWGAYLGTPDELLVAGRLEAVAEEIVAVRAEARARKGWMFDTYLLRRP